MKGYLRISPVLAGVMMATGTIGVAGAQCVTTQDCKALGYTESSCSGGKGVKCPFGNGWVCCPSSKEVCQSEGFKQACTGTGQIGSGESCAGLYKKCTCQSTYQYSCTGTGYAGGAGSACGGKYAQCICADKYKWNGTACMSQDGPQGDLYYCNGKVVGVKVPGTSVYLPIFNEFVPTFDWYELKHGEADYPSIVYECGMSSSISDTTVLKTIYEHRNEFHSLVNQYGGDFSLYHCYLTYLYPEESNYCQKTFCLDEQSGTYSRNGCGSATILFSYTSNG